MDVYKIFSKTLNKKLEVNQSISSLYEISKIKFTVKVANITKNDVEYINYLHNKVNKQLGKPVYSYSKAITLYKKYYKGLDADGELHFNDYSTHIEDSNMNFVKYLQISGLTIVLILLIIYLVKKRNIKKIRFL